ncbi:MAG: transcriptional regulator GcvA [Rhizobiaceae bacterium]|nr:transcriptional regulator GcvA [Rhizobiaceae bacterium]
MRKIPPVNAIRAFEAACRHLQFQLAAEELGVTPAALSYQIRQLEEHLGLKLFRRLNRAVELTREGRILAPGIITAFETLEESFSLLSPQEDNKLVISTGPAFSAKWLAPRLHSYLEEHPEIDFRLSANLKLTDFDRDDVDAVIRFGAGKYPELFVEPLFQEISTPLISPKLFEEAGGIADESLFEHVTLVHDESLRFLEASQWGNWLSGMNYDTVDPDRGVHFSHADHCIEAAVDGSGIVMARLGFAFREINAGRLIAPFKQAISARGGFYFCCPPENLEKEKVLHFLAWLRDEAQAQEEAITEFMKDRVLIGN